MLFDYPLTEIKTKSRQIPMKYLLLALLLTVFSCSEHSSSPQKIKQVKKTYRGRPLRIALSAAFVSEQGHYIYNKISSYLSDQTGYQIDFDIDFNYRTINELLATGAVDAAFICGLPYVLLKDGRKEVQLLVAPIMKNPRYQDKPIYYSDLIVHRDSSYHKVEDLRGKIFIFNDKISNSGYNLPRNFLIKNGLKKGFIKKSVRSGSHESSIKAVANRSADFSFVDSLVLDFELEKGSNYASDVRVIRSIGPSGIPPLVINSNLDQELKLKLKNALLQMHHNPTGRQILKEALLKRFEEVSDSNYDDIRNKNESAKAADYLTIK